MIRSYLVILVIFCMLGCAAMHKGNKTNLSGEELKSGLVYGDNYTFGLTAPEGWVLDNTSGDSLGLNVVFYPRESSWQTTTKDMYASVMTKRDEGKESILEVIDRDISSFKKKSPIIVVEDAPELLITKKGERAIVKYFKNSIRRNYEAIAYIDEDGLVVLLVYGSDSAEEFEASLGAFKELVASYFYLDTKIRIIK